KLVEIGQPLGDEPTRETESTKKRFRTEDLGRNSRGGQSLEHHDRESLHALLAIKRVITDQQNHQDDVVPWPHHASARRNANAVRSGWGRAAVMLPIPSAPSYCRPPCKGRKQTPRTRGSSAGQTGR